MATDADIANMALSRLGTRATIAALSENSTEARAIATWYSTVRDSLMRARDWNFSRVTAALASSGTPPARWSQSYAYPSDCLRLLRLDMGGASWTAGDSANGQAGVLFEIGSDGASRFLWCNEAPVSAVYSQRVTDPNRMDAEFVAAFAATLAAAVAYPLTQRADVAARLQAQAREAQGEAGVADSNEQSLLGRGGGWADYESAYIAARG